MCRKMSRTKSTTVLNNPSLTPTEDTPEMATGPTGAAITDDEH